MAERKSRGPSAFALTFLAVRYKCDVRRIQKAFADGDFEFYYDYFGRRWWRLKKGSVL